MKKEMPPYKIEDFESFSKEKKYKILTQQKLLFKELISGGYSPISILLSGSTVYGYNTYESGRLNDLDCTAIVPSELNYIEFVNFFKTLTQKYKGFVIVDLPDEISFQKAICGTSRDNVIEPDIFRVEARLNGIKISIHSMGIRTYKSIQKHFFKPLYNVIPSGHKRLIDNDGWFTELGTDNRIQRFSRLVKYGSDKLLSKEYIFRRIKDQENKIFKGTLGDKLLSAEILIDADNIKAQEILDSLWLKFLALTYKQIGTMPNSEIIKSFSRSARFSEKYSSQLNDKINYYKNILNV